MAQHRRGEEEEAANGGREERRREKSSDHKQMVNNSGLMLKPEVKLTIPDANKRAGCRSGPGRQVDMRPPRGTRLCQPPPLADDQWLVSPELWLTWGLVAEHVVRPKTGDAPSARQLALQRRDVLRGPGGARVATRGSRHRREQLEGDEDVAAGLGRGQGSHLCHQHLPPGNTNNRIALGGSKQELLLREYAQKAATFVRSHKLDQVSNKSWCRNSGWSSSPYCTRKQASQ